jgi:hypothetical protein
MPRQRARGPENQIVKKARKPAQCEFLNTSWWQQQLSQPRELAKTLEQWRHRFEGDWSLDLGKCKTIPAKNSQLTQCHQRIQESHGTTPKNRVKRIIGKIGENLFFGFFRTNSTLFERFRGLWQQAEHATDRGFFRGFLKR